MDRKEYNIAINKNALECWGIIIGVLVIAYFVELLKGARTVPYFLIFLGILFIPYIGSLIWNRRYRGSLNFKYVFVLSYLVLYTFVLLTTRTYVTYVYIIPMASVLIAYCDSKLTYFMYLYVIAINILSIYLQYTGLGNSDLVFSLSDRVTMWEIQIALLVLSGVFLSKSCTLIKKRDEILDTLSDDVCKDALTDVYNKKYIENNVHRLFATKKTKSVAFIDVDDFKKFNTLYGHNFGDEVLVTLCEVITSEINDYEDTSLIRVGGDEFIIFSLDFNKEEFTKKLKEIVKKVSTTKIPFGKKKVGIEISVGVASSDIDECDGFTELYNIADKRNGKAKKNGKNCVEDN